MSEIFVTFFGINDIMFSFVCISYELIADLPMVNLKLIITVSLGITFSKMLCCISLCNSLNSFNVIYSISSFRDLILSQTNCDINIFLLSFCDKFIYYNLIMENISFS